LEKLAFFFYQTVGVDSATTTKLVDPGGQIPALNWDFLLFRCHFLGTMSSKGTPGLYEFLQEAELAHYYTGLRNILQVGEPSSAAGTVPVFPRNENLFQVGEQSPRRSFRLATQVQNSNLQVRESALGTFFRLKTSSSS
jgi:hypothetical protein